MSSPRPAAHEVDLARGAVAAPVQLAAEARGPTPSPVPTERNTKSSTPARHPAPALADGGEVDVVLDA